MCLELFAGSGRMARALERATGLPCIALDLAAGAHCDLTRRAVLQTVIGWVRARVVRCAWAGFPCTTWSIARRPALRSREHLGGLPHMLTRERERQIIGIGTRTLQATLRFADACRQQLTPLILENPHSSLAWQWPRMMQACRAPEATCVVTDYCQFKTRWRRRTRLVGFHVPFLQTLARRCTGQAGLCSATGGPHVHLHGVQARLAETYPAPLATLAAGVLRRAADQVHLAHLWQLGG